VSEIRAVSGPVLSDDTGYLLCAGRPLMLQPYQFRQLARLGMWSDEPVVQAIRNKDFSLIVVATDPVVGDSDFFTDRMLEAMAENYREKQIAGRYFVLEPMW